ncbi:ZIP family metal transporter [Halomarina litorea]|uniref:ZIP family metal transporter n=1 Tax=Halomarina litorea TaxID=2961595 RepID=UPI0020C4428A|nr:ZIP family metal transporter [Halomarina sp. BCD28]
MGITDAVGFNGRSGSLAVGGVAVVALLALSVAALSAGLWKVTTIAWVAFTAMGGGIPLGVRAATRTADATGTDHEFGARRLVWGYGLASGAMIASAAAFLLPQAIGLHPKLGGFGVAAGILIGFASHVVGHRLAHLDLPFDRTAAHLSAHALSAGLIIGLVYGTMSEVGLLLGLAIVSHKGPAGYAAARRLARNGRDATVLLLPAAGVGLTAIPGAYVGLPSIPTINAAVFGFAAGIFLHVAMDFLPRCEIGSEVTEVAGIEAADHGLLDRLRLHAVASTFLGGAVVFAAWAVLGF